MNVPKIRFAGCSTDWTIVPFKELYQPSSVKNDMSFGSDKIISVANMYFRPVSYISSDDYLRTYNIFRLGDIAFEGNRSKKYSHGRFVENSIGDGIVSHVFVVLRPIMEKYDINYWKEAINNERIMGPILSRSTKSSTMMHDLVVGDFLKESIAVPSYIEQRTIGRFFNALDSLIEATGKKITSLKQTKQACLQQMFPAEGETTPRVRFKGFEGEWEKKQIGDISTSTKGKGYSKADLREFGTPIILYGRLYTKYSFEMDNIDTCAMPVEGTIYSAGNEVVIPASGETAEDIAIAAAIKQKGVILGGDLNILTFTEEYDPAFMALCITNSGTHYELSRFAQGKSVVHLRNNDIANGHVVCPTLAEQQQIAAFFSNMDKQIRIQEQRLEKLKQIKSACLENMFV